MKKVFRIFVLLGILSLGFSSCSDDDGYSLGNRYYTLGTVEAKGGDIVNGFDIRLDNGSLLVINNSNYFLRLLKDNDRVVTITTLLGDLEPVEGNKRYLAILNDYGKILSKRPVLQSFIDYNYEHRQDSIGNDPIRVYEAWFGGKYLNVEFGVARKVGTNEVHFINLVADDVDWDNGRMDLYLRHNGYEDVPAAGSTNFGFGKSMVSFDLTGLIPEGKEALDITLHWTDYVLSEWETTEDKTDTGTFRPYGTSNNTPDTNQIEFSFGSEVK